MADYVDFSDDMILPDGFDANTFDSAESLDAAMSTEAPAPTTEPTLGDAPASEPTVDNGEELTSEPTTTQEAPAFGQTIKVKFNHEERELGLDEAAIYAQKGMNYDKMEERVRAFEADRAKTERLAKNLGYDSAEEMIEAAEQNYINRQIRELVEEGNTESMAKFLVEQRMAKAAEAEAARASSPVGTPNQQQSQAPAMSDARRAELDEFVKAFPGVTKLPDEVIEANRNGVRLKTAYENYQLKQKYDEQQKQLNILKQNQSAAARAPVTGTVGKAAPKKEEPEDFFMKGFDSAY